MEEVNQTFELVLRELRAQYEGFKTEAVQEKFDAVRLDDIIRIDKGLAFENTELKEGEEDHELLEVSLALDVVVLLSLEPALHTLVIVQLDYEGFRLPHKCLLDSCFVLISILSLELRSDDGFKHRGLAQLSYFKEFGSQVKCDMHVNLIKEQTGNLEGGRL